MKVAVYKKALIPFTKDPFIGIIDCDGLDEKLADGETGKSFFDEAGKCKSNPDCRAEMDAYYDGYFSVREYCVSLEEHERRTKND